MNRAVSPLAQAILVALASADRTNTGGVSLPRLCKQLGQGASVLLRELSMMDNAVFAGHAGPGWVQVEQSDGRWLVHLTDAGRAALYGRLAHTDDGPAA